MPPTLTVLITFHREGHVAFSALRSAVLAIDRASQRGVGCHLVAVIDRGDDQTRAEVARFHQRLHAVHHVDYGDISLARNHAIARVETSHLAFLDGDDVLDRDWLWKGMRVLQAAGDDRTVAHAHVRVHFGAEHAVRIQIGTDNSRFHPLNLIATWHWAVDVIAPTALFRRLPFAPRDHEHNIGGEDWLWSCESLVQGVRHLLVPETAYFYRRQPAHVGMGSLHGFTFPPSRLFTRGMLAKVHAEYPSAAVSYVQGAGVAAEPERWSDMPPWLERALEQACACDVGLFNAYSQRHYTPLCAPHIFPSIAHFYSKLMAEVGPGRHTAVFLCQRLTPETLRIVDDFVAERRRLRTPPLHVLMVSLAATKPPVRAARSEGGRVDGATAPRLHIRHVDLGAEPAFVHLPQTEQHLLLVRWLMQARPSLMVNIDSALCDGMVGAFGPALQLGRARTVRMCHATDVPERDQRAFWDWQHLLQAQGRYSYAVCRNSRSAEHLGWFFQGTSLQVIAANEDAGPGSHPSRGARLHALMMQSPTAPGRHEIRAEPTLSNTPDVSLVVSLHQAGYFLNASARLLRSIVQEAEREHLRVEIIVAAHRPGPATERILADLLARWPGLRQVQDAQAGEGTVLNAAMAEAKGAFVALLPAAELVSPGWLPLAVRRCQTAGTDTVVRPQSLVEYGQRLRIRHQPDLDRETGSLDRIGFDPLWTDHLLARRELFQRIPFHHASAGLGYGHPVWHWTCETVAQGCRHVTVPMTAAYRRADGGQGEHHQRLGSLQSITLPPSSFFTARFWQRPPRDGEALRIWDEAAYLDAHPDVAQAVRQGRVSSGHEHYQKHGKAEGRLGRWTALGPRDADDVPDDWDEAAYLRAWPDVALAVSHRDFRSGFAHYCRHGRHEGRAPTWMDPPAKAPHRRSTVTMPAWLRKHLRHIPPSLQGLAEGLSGTTRSTLLTSALDQDMRTLAPIDPNLLPHLAGPVSPMPDPDPWLTEVYRRLRQVAAVARPTHIVLVPALRVGGAERAMRVAIDALVTDPENRVLVITTEVAEDSSRAPLPPGCSWFAFPVHGTGTSAQRQEVLTRFLLNAGARVLHLFYSELGWEVFRRYAPALAKSMRIFVSVFGVPSTCYDNSIGYAQYLPALLPYLSGILTDNRGLPRFMSETCGLPLDRFAVVHHPVPAMSSFPIPDDACRDVLWASRVDRGKRPDLLAAVARAMPQWRFHVYGEPVVDTDEQLRMLRTIPNISYRGGFTGFDTIPPAVYRCFLYTSAADGMPNVVLEAMRAGLLVVASDVGGVGEVVKPETGVLVQPADEPMAYVRAIERTLTDHPTWRQVAARGQAYVIENHTTEVFQQGLRAIPGYF